MGGQACVLYGAAEFSRDADFAIVPDANNLAVLQSALDELQAKEIAVPPFQNDYLQRGHAVHFRCFHPEADQMRINLMAVMRGVDAFDELWKRRTTIELDDQIIELLSLPDLVKAKKTQRDKDWPMIQRLLEVHYLQLRDEPTPARIEFWLRELRTPTLLREIGAAYPRVARNLSSERVVLRELSNSEADIEAALHAEEEIERQRDRAYWQPLKAEFTRICCQPNQLSFLAARNSL